MRLALLTACWLAADATATSRSPDRIAFASKRDGNWEIYVAEGDGSRQTRLTDSPFQDRFPLWSPDRRLLAFGSERDGAWELWVMTAEGKAPKRLVRGIAAKGGRRWSPDGTRIVYESKGDLYTVRVADGVITRLTNDAVPDRDPDWSPDGRWIAYTSLDPAGATIRVMPSGGGAARAVITAAPDGGSASWSPDGKWLAHVGGKEGAREVWIVRPDGTGARAVATPLAGDVVRWSPLRWSPDGTRLVYQTLRGTDDYDLEMVTVADGRRSALAPAARYDGMATWSPDGARIAFVSDRDGVEQLLSIVVGSGAVTRLAASATLNPDWAR